MCQAHFSATGDRLEQSFQSFASLRNVLPRERSKRHNILTVTVKPLLTLTATLQYRSSNVRYRHDRWPFSINHTQGILDKSITSSPTRPLSEALNRAQILPKKLNKPGQLIHYETCVVLAWLAQTLQLAHLNRMPCNKFHHSRHTVYILLQHTPTSFLFLVLSLCYDRFSLNSPPTYLWHAAIKRKTQST